MRNFLKSLAVLFSTLFIFLCALSFNIAIANSNLAIILEQQENSNDTAIRYIATLENVDDLNSIDSIEFNFTLYKYISTGSYYEANTVSTTKVYTSVTGENGKELKANTYYAVYTLNITAEYSGYTISCYVTAKSSDSIIYRAEEISYTINDSALAFYKGMDSSCVPSLEAAGVKYYNFDNEEEDVFKILADNGVNCIRVRIWNDPYYTSDGVKYGYGGGNCDLENCLEIGKRASKYGMKLLVDFHYSDFWADPGKQSLPKAWAGYSNSLIESAIYDFTYDSLAYLLNHNVAVGMVQVGNETNDAMCGSIGESTMETVCGFMNKGTSAVRAISADYDTDIKVALHFANPANYSTYQWYASELDTYNVDYDVFGTSYYPYWHGSITNLTSILTYIATTYDKEVAVLETSYANNTTDSYSDDYPNTVYTRDYELNDSSASPDAYLPYDFTVEGQYNQILNVMNAISSIKVNSNQKGIGVFYWEGTWIGATEFSSLSSDTLWETYGCGWGSKYAYYYDSSTYSLENGGCAVENEAFFNKYGKPYNSLKVFKANIGTDKALKTQANDYLGANMTNSSFEDGNLNGWTYEASSGMTFWPAERDCASDGSYVLSFGSSNTYSFNLYQDLTGEVGTYTLSCKALGDKISSGITLYVQINGADSKTTTISISKSNWTSSDWKTYTTSEFELDGTETSVIIGVRASNISGGSWGLLDYFNLTSTSIPTGTTGVTD